MQNKEYPQNKSNKDIKAWWTPALILFGKFSGWILFPLIIGYTLGKWLDVKNNSEPLFFLLTIGISFFISMYGLIKNTLSEYKKIEKEENNSKISSQGESASGGKNSTSAKASVDWQKPISKQ